MPLSSDDVVLLFGATGAVGVGALQLLLERGAHVVIHSRSQDKVEHLKKKFSARADHIHEVVTKDNHSEETFLQIKKLVVDKFGEDGLSHVVSSQGGQVFDAQGISGTSSEQLEASFRDKVVSHHATVRHFYPLLLKSKNPSPSFTFMTGASGEMCFDVRASLMTICNAATFGLVLALQKEAESTKVRVNEFRLAAIVSEKTDELVHGMKPNPPEFAGKVIVGIINSSQRGKKLFVRTQEDADKAATLE
eukprot:TRINITY_DN16075_c0_g1_i1.p1 TRINITY_DN16075_c0_g1~~TRINITY_DN16075_c0_g1_i1.p1  ORF type:complete len:249 (+),score=83.17 TRINITY_DN16075_c0_g1_i1:81-827(+)